ncbi:MAG TPA: hypothetical protein VK308_12010, partial [Pyrinomonadaceae bacterium]|nr:hypothetical protein [Pyrinomonadaceae bacterium]
NLLKIVSSKDEKLSRKLLQRLAEITENSNQDEIKNNGEAITDTAVAVADNDAQKAFNLGVSAIRLGKSTFSIVLFWKLQKKNPSLADSYFQAGINRLQKDVDLNFFLRLKQAGFPESEFPDYAANPKPKPNDLLRKRFLDILANYLKAEADDFLEKRISVCEKNSRLGLRLEIFFAQLLPERVQMINYSREVCENPRGQTENDFIKKQFSLKTVEEFLAAAEESNDQRQKDNYRISAAQMALKEKKFKQAIEILEIISEEGRKSSNGVWNSLHRESWMGFVVKLFKANELAALYETLKKSPDNLRPYLYLTVIEKCEKETDKPLAYEFLNGAREDFKKINFEPTKDFRILLENPGALSAIPKEYARFDYVNEAIESHLEAIKGLNKFIEKIPTEERPDRIPGLPIVWQSYTNFSGKFFETHFQNINDNAAAVELPLMRARIRLDILKFCLKKLTEAEKRELELKTKLKQAEK